MACWRDALAQELSPGSGGIAAGRRSRSGLAEFGRDVRGWRKVSAVALHGWVLCSDGRLYHRVVAEKALEAWMSKLAQRRASGAGNAKRWGAQFDPAAVDAEIMQAVAALSAVNPQSRALIRPPQSRPGRNSGGTPGGTPDGIPSGSQQRGRGIVLTYPEGELRTDTSDVLSDAVDVLSTVSARGGRH